MTYIFDLTGKPQEIIDEVVRELDSLPEAASAWWRVNVATGEKEKLVVEIAERGA